MNFFEKLFDTPIIIHRNQMGLKVFTDIRHLVAENGVCHPLVSNLITNAAMGMPIAFVDSNGDFFFGKEEDKCGFFVGHEFGHLFYKHLNGAKRALIEINDEIAADRYAINNGFCTVNDAIKILEDAKSKLYGGFWKWLLRVFSRKSEQSLEQRIAALKAL